MTVLGPVTRLQVQRSRLKPGPRGSREYDPSPITAVEALRVDGRGATGLLGGAEVADVHHPEHPDSRHRRGVNGLSLMTTGGYARLRARYGPHLADGVAGESVLIDTPGALGPALEGAPLEVLTADGPVPLTGVTVCSPCVEFTRWCLRLEPDAPVDDALLAAMDDLDHGARGLLAAAGPGTIRPGDVVRVAR